MKNNPSESTQKLAAYASLAVAAIALHTDTQAAIQYTDIDPDTLVTGNGSIYDLDLDNNGSADFRFKANANVTSVSYFKDIDIKALGNNQVLAETFPFPTTWGATWPYGADGLSNGQMIKPVGKWGPGSYPTYWGSFSVSIPGTLDLARKHRTFPYGDFSGGHFLGTSDQYIGLQLEVSAQHYFGWIRVDVSANADSLWIKDFAFEDLPNTAIAAGAHTQSPADSVSNLAVADVSDFGDGQDLQISFDKVSDESIISGYRAYIVKSINASGFDLNAAQVVNGANYTTIAKTGNNISQVLPATANDVDGDPITNHSAYKLFIMTVADGIQTTLNALSSPSDEITLLSPFADPVTNINLSDVSEFQDGRDLQVDFDQAQNENTIDEYRIIIVKSADAGTFDLAMANNVGPANYFQVAKTGSPVSTTLDSTSTDKDGDLIIPDTLYQAFVLSIADGSMATLNTLSGPSNAVQLFSYRSADTVTITQVMDIDNHHDGRDLEISFNKAADETTIDEYRAIVVTEAAVPGFFPHTANALPPDRYLAIAKTGNNLTVTLPANAKDSDGDPVVENINYRIFIHSIADGFYAGINSLSGPSPVVKLTNTIAADGVTNITAADISDHQDGRDMEIGFPKAADENTIYRYRLIVVPSADAAAFDLAAADALPVGRYMEIQKTNADIQTTLDSNSTDIHGIPITEQMPYKVFVLSLADGNNATVNTLSGPSNEVTLTSIPSGLKEDNEAVIQIYTANQQLFADIPHRNGEPINLSVYSMNGQLLRQYRFNQDNIRLQPYLSPNNLYIVEVKRGQERTLKKVKF